MAGILKITPRNLCWLALICTLAGIGIVALYQWAAYRRLVDVQRNLELIRIAGGRVTRDESKPERPLIGVDLLGKDIDRQTLALYGKHMHIETMNLAWTSIRDDWLEELRPLRNLKTLYLGSTRITDAGAKRLVDWEHLETVNLGDTTITDDAVTHLAELPNLVELYLGNTAITDSSLSEIERIGTLRRLDVNGTQVTPAGVARLQKARPNLEIHVSFDEAP